MTPYRIRPAALMGAAVIALASAPVGGQMLVYDPSNDVQNVLQAARALQQINNQISSLQNQTQMLLNQAKNLASLRYSSLPAIEQSVSRTQQLLNQAQRLRYDISEIDGCVPGRPPGPGWRRASARYGA
jgi:P-type conjugative transfer protein TrbJ